MKKSLVALAVLAASGAAMAQSSVTLFGIVDAGYAVGNGSISDKTSMRNSGYNSSRLGFRGVEDLGGGMKAGFHLEGALSNDDGTPGGFNFQRRSVVTLSGKMGELILGRDYTPQFWSETVYDPFGTNGVGTNIAFNKGGTTGVRSNNGIGYKSPSMGGVALWAQTWLAENASTAPKTGGGNGFRVTFDQGKFSAAFADSTLTTGVGTTNKTSNIAGSYDLGVAKVMVQSNTTKITGAANIKGSVIGAHVPMAGGTFRIASSQTDQAGKKSSLMAVGFVNPLSKRTDLYATYARVSNSGGANAALNGAVTAANASSTGYEFGVKHSF
jgi:predicted porin